MGGRSDIVGLGVQSAGTVLAGKAATAATAKATAAGASSGGAAAAGALASFGVTLAFAAVLYVYSNWQANKERRKELNRAAQREINLRGEDAGKPIPLLYGYTGGQALVAYANAVRGWHASGSAYAGALGRLDVSRTQLDDQVGRNPVLLQQGVLGFGEIESIDRVLVDDRELAGEVGDTSLVKKMPDGPVADPMATLNDRATVVKLYDGLTGLTALHWQRSGDPKYGGGRPPVLYAFVKGRKLRRVVRTGSAGNYSYDLSAARTFTNNAVLVLLDYLLEPDIGAIGLTEADLDLESWYGAQEVAGERQFANAPSGQDRPWLTIKPRFEQGVDPGTRRTDKRTLDETLYFTKEAATIPDAPTLQELYHGDDDWTRLDAGGKPTFEQGMAKTWWVRVDYIGTTGRERKGDVEELTAANPPANYPAATPAILAEERVNSGLAYGADFIRYQYDGAVRTDVDALQIVQQIMETMPGAIFWRGEDSLFRLSLGDGTRTAADQAGAKRIDDTWLLAPVAIEYPDANDKLNSLEMSYPDIALDFATNVVTFPGTEETTLKTVLMEEDGDVLLHDSDTYEGITNNYHAHSAAANLILQSRRPRYSFETSLAALDIQPGDIVRLVQQVTGMDEHVRIERKDVTPRRTVAWTAREFQPVDFQWIPRGQFDPGQLTEPDLTIPAPTSVRVAETPDSNIVSVDWVADRRNVASWYVARLEGATADEIGVHIPGANSDGADAPAVAFLGLNPTAVANHNFRLQAATGLRLPNAFAHPVAAPRFLVGFRMRGAGRMSLNFDTDDDAATPAVSSEVDIGTLGLVFVVRYSGVAYGFQLSEVLQLDVEDPYNWTIPPGNSQRATYDALWAALPKALPTIDGQPGTLDDIEFDVAFVNPASPQWTGGGNWDRAFAGRIAPPDGLWEPVATVPADQAPQATDVIERGTHDYFYRVRGQGIGGGHSAWAYSDLAMLTDNLAVPVVARPSGGPIFCRTIPAGGIGRAGVTDPGAGDDPEAMAADRAYLKTFWLHEGTDAADRTELSHATPQALTRIWRLWASIDDEDDDDENIRYFRQVRGTSPIVAITLWWDDLQDWWVQIPLARRTAGNLSGVGVNQALNFVGIDVSEGAATDTGNNRGVVADVQGREYGPRWDIKDSAPHDANHVSQTRRLCFQFTVAQKGKDGEDAAAFISNVPFTVS